MRGRSFLLSTNNIKPVPQPNRTQHHPPQRSPKQIRDRISEVTIFIHNAIFNVRDKYRNGPAILKIETEPSNGCSQVSFASEMKFCL